MAKKNSKSKRKVVGLVSTASNHRTYYTTKHNSQQEKLSLKKYDPVVRKHVEYVETKKSLGRNEVKPRKG